MLELIRQAEVLNCLGECELLCSLVYGLLCFCGKEPEYQRILTGILSSGSKTFAIAKRFSKTELIASECLARRWRGPYRRYPELLCYSKNKVKPFGAGLFNLAGLGA